MPVRIFCFKESLRGVSTYTFPGGTGAHGSLSLQRSLQSDCFVLFFPVCITQKGKEEEDSVWLLGGQSTESFPGPLLFMLSMRKTLFLMSLLLAKSTMCFPVEKNNLLENTQHNLSGCMGNVVTFHHNMISMVMLHNTQVHRMWGSM